MSRARRDRVRGAPAWADHGIGVIAAHDHRASHDSIAGSDGHRRTQ